MKRWIFALVFVFHFTAMVSASSTYDHLKDLLPSPSDLPSFSLSDPPETYRGEKLFMMINGGADIYQEYGFLQVTAASFVDQNEKLISLEIYEMEDPASAYGIYTFKTAGEGESLTLGSEAYFQDYYLNFRKKNFLVTVIGMDSDEHTRKSIITLAKAVDAKIPEHTTATPNDIPTLAEKLIHGTPGLTSPLYVKGPLALGSAYFFDTKDIFEVKEGVAGNFEGCTAFVFQYVNEEKSGAVFKQATAVFESGKRYSKQEWSNNALYMIDRDGRHVLTKFFNQYIIAVIGDEKNKISDVSDHVLMKLK